MENFSKEILCKENGKCDGCISCCTVNLPLTKIEFKRMKQLLTKKVLDNFRRKNEEEIYLVCPFAEKEKGCTIYNDRPSICKVYHCDKNYIDIPLAAILNKQFIFKYNFMDCFPKKLALKLKKANLLLNEYENNNRKNGDDGIVFNKI